MKFPSLKNLGDSFESTVRRFPFELLFAVAGTVAGILYINNGSGVQLNESIYTRVMMVANLGLLLSLSTTLFAESKGNKKWVLRTIVALLGGCFLFVFNRQLHIIDGLRFFLLSLAFHLLVAFAAFTAKGQVQGFWQFNKTLFLRFLTSALYSGVLYIGLAAAIGASNFLFNLNIHDKTYGTLFALIAGVFNTVFFLAGVPTNIAGLESDDTYPKGLKVFTQYVLIPLASVYVIILLAYEVKILIQWNLPKGLVSNLILGYAVFGILSILLVYPLRNQEGNKWIKTYSRSFYFLLMPLIVLLFLAIASRILPYGVTAPRYFLIVLALWLMFITTYFLLSRKQNIKIIPISLCILALLSVYGPQSAFSVSGYSQRHILVKIFKKYGAVKDGKLTSLEKIKVSKKDGNNAVEKMHYFVYDNDISGLQPYIDKNINNVIDSILHEKNSRGDRPDYGLKSDEMEWAIKYLGLNKFNENGMPKSFNYFFEVKNDQLLKIKGYDYELRVNRYSVDSEANPINVDGIQMIKTVDNDNIWSLSLNSEKVSFNVKEIAVGLIKSESSLNIYRDNNYNYGKNFTLPDQLLSFTKQTRHFKITFLINGLRVHYKDIDDMSITEFNGLYLITALK